MSAPLYILVTDYAYGRDRYGRGGGYGIARLPFTSPADLVRQLRSWHGDPAITLLNVYEVSR